MALAKNDVFTAEILAVSSDGNGIAKPEGYTVFVPLTAVGDICEIRLVKCAKKYGYGRLERIVKPSSDRIEPVCRIFSQCGGCSYQHISYAAEVNLKAQMVRDAFERIAGLHVPMAEIIPAQQCCGYRNKAQYPVGIDARGNPVSGFYARRSHRIIPGENCLLQPPVFEQIRRDVMEYLRRERIPSYEESNGKGIVRHIYLRQGTVTGEIMLCLVVTQDLLPGVEEFAEGIAQKYPQLTSVVLNINSDRTNVILGKGCRTVWGSGTIEDILCGIRIELSPLSFYQVNHDQAEKLYQKALEYAQLSTDMLLLDLYCGAGTIGLSAAGEVKKLIGVEIVPEAVENARENARRNGIENAEFYCGDAAWAAEKFVSQGLSPDVIIVDPPRKGLDMQVIESITAMCPSRVVMVSCNPATAARDTALLHERGYTPIEVTPVDLFPRTTHVECVVLMKKHSS